MATDHYVSQTHLRGWLGEGEDRLYAIRKSDLGTFRPGTHSVCGAIDGNTNNYLNDPRVIEQIVKPIEDGYAVAVERVASLPDQLEREHFESIAILAGWIAYVETSSPAAMRLGTEQISPVLEELMVKADAAGEFRDLPPPPVLGGKSVSELLSSGEIRVKVDPKYPQAMAVEGWNERVRMYSNSGWQFLHNAHADSPFFTSDFPIVMEPTARAHLFHKVVPLSPTLAVRIVPWWAPDAVRKGPAFSAFKWQTTDIGRDEVKRINTMIVRSAENIVIYRGPLIWVERFVRKHAMFRTASQTEVIGPYRITRRLMEKAPRKAT